MKNILDFITKYAAALTILASIAIGIFQIGKHFGYKEGIYEKDKLQYQMQRQLDSINLIPRCP